MKRSSEKSFSAAMASSGADGPSIALLTLDFPPSVGGVQQYLYEVSRRMGHRCRLTVIVPGDDASRMQGLPFAIHAIPSHKTSAFWRALKQVHPDVILVGHAHPRLLVPARAAQRRYITITYGNDFEAAQRRWHRPFFNRMLRRSRPLITISRQNAQRLVTLGIPEPIIIPPGTDPDRFTPPDIPRTGPPVLLTVGRLVRRKGVDTVLRSLPSLLEQRPELRYWIAGTGPELPALQRLAQESGVAHAVTFLGFVPDADLPELYRQASIFVMPTRADRNSGDVEGFGIVYLEAGASGLPVVAADSGGATDAVRDDKTGLLVPPDDPAALTRALTYLLDNPDAAAKMGAAGRRWVEDEMNWDRAAAQLFHVLELPY